jgi:hypothetical protein
MYYEKMQQARLTLIFGERTMTFIEKRLRKQAVKMAKIIIKSGMETDWKHIFELAEDYKLMNEMFLIPGGTVKQFQWKTYVDIIQICSVYFMGDKIDACNRLFTMFSSMPYPWCRIIQTVEEAEISINRFIRYRKKSLANIENHNNYQYLFPMLD